MFKIKIWLLFILVVTLEGLAYQIVEFEVYPNTEDSAKVSYSYLIDCGYRDKFIDYGMNFTVMRRDSFDIYYYIGIGQVFNIGPKYSKMKRLFLSDDLVQRSRIIENFAAKDYVYPSLIFDYKDLFITDDSLSVKGKELVDNKVLPFFLKTRAKKIKILNFFCEDYGSRDRVHNLGGLVKDYLREKYAFKSANIDLLTFSKYQKATKSDRVNCKMAILFVKDGAQDGFKSKSSLTYKKRKKETPVNPNSKDGTLSSNSNLKPQRKKQPSKVQGVSKIGTSGKNKANEIRYKLADLDQNKLVFKNNEVILVGDLCFDFDKTDILPKYYPDLAKIKQIFDKNPDISIQIETHTDSRGSRNYNLKLSEERANSVKDYLVSKLLIPAGKITTLGKGEDFPLIGNDTEANRALNRRVEFRIIKNKFDGAGDKAKLKEKIKPPKKIKPQKSSGLKKIEKTKKIEAEKKKDEDEGLLKFRD